jgi:VanZ family protein
MPTLHELLHAPHLRRTWRLVLLVTMAAVSWFAFAPDAPELDMEQADKVNHVAAFGTLAALALLCAAPGWRPTMAAATGLLAYGGFIELVQTQLPTRHGDLADLVADAVGIALGLGLSLTARRLFPPRKGPD